MAFFMLLAVCYAVAQLAVIGWPTRSVRFGTLFAATAVGLYGCGSVALLLQLVYTRSVAATTHEPLSEVVTRASYTVDPVIEEVVKVLPLLIVLVFVRRLRHQWGLTDFLLIGAATGGGFSLAEGLLRWGQSGTRAVSDSSGGWNIITGLSYQHVPGFGEFIGRWLPAPVYTVGALSVSAPSTSDLVAIHLVWTAIAGFGIGVLVRARSWRKLFGLLPLAYTCADHAAFNYGVQLSTPPPWYLRALSDLREGVWFYPLLLLLVAIALDLWVLRGIRGARPDLLLAVERDGSGGLLRFATVSPRFTVPIAMRFAMARRSLRYALWRRPDTEIGALLDAVRGTRDRMDAAGDEQRWRLARGQLPPLRTRALRIARSWQLWLWLILLLPTLLYLVLGSFPSLSGLQRFLARPAIFPVMAIISVIGLGWLAWQLVGAARSVPVRLRRQYGDPVARAGFRIAAGVGAFAAGTASLVTWLRGTGPTAPVIHNFHILDALSNLLLVASIALFLLSLFIFPPLALAELTTGGFVLVTTAATEAFLASAAASGLLGSLGILLAQAAGNGDGGGGDGGGDSGGSDPDQTAREQRLDDLAKDPAHGDKISPASRQEARVSLDLEESGQLDGPIQRDPTGGSEFIDANGQDWDVKGFNSNYPPARGGYDLPGSMSKITDALRTGENVILDTSKLSPQAVQELRAAVEAVPQWAGRILWWP